MSLKSAWRKLKVWILTKKDIPNTEEQIQDALDYQGF